MADIRRFHLERKIDCSGVSGCGKVAVGCLFEDSGQIALHWLGAHGSINIYASMEDVMFVHGHQGATRVVFDDAEEEKKSSPKN